MVIFRYKYYYNSNHIYTVKWGPSVEKQDVEEISDNITSNIAEELNIKNDDIRKVLGFADTPWDCEKDIMEFMNSLDCIDESYYYGVYDGAYGPPKIVYTYSDVDFEETRDKILWYYGGFSIEKEKDGKGVVHITPTMSVYMSS